MTRTSETPTAIAIDPLALVQNPAVIGQHGARARRRAFGEEVWVRPAPAHAPPAVACVLRGAAILELAAWPEPAALVPGDRVVTSKLTPKIFDLQRGDVGLAAIHPHSKQRRQQQTQRRGGQRAGHRLRQSNVQRREQDHDRQGQRHQE